MNDPNNIVVQPLPVSQDFEALKDEGLEFIQKYSKGEWTNFNPSDSGVTILDQVCYALTELGYCNDFPIEDILTGPDEKLKVDNQFYLPESILTSSPLTIDDYRKYLIDAIKNVYNAVIIPESKEHNTINGIYNTYLLINPAINDCDQVKNITKSAYNQLNKSRNLGEIFNMPMPLNPNCIEKIKSKDLLVTDENQNAYLFSGSIEISKLEELNGIVNTLQDKINNYIFPRVFQTGYDVLSEEGLEIDEIFNGPVLRNGWIKTDALGTKKDQINSSEMINLFLTVSGILSVAGLSFWNSLGKKYNVECGESELLIFNLLQSINEQGENGLKLFCDGRQLQPAEIKKFLFVTVIGQFNNANINSVASTVLAPPLPEGRFRDINSYYSIQNTFPEAYAVGLDSTPANASEFQIAQSRQLKGYLTLFDQVLANQFSQLANVSSLFSFNNMITGDPSDVEEFYKEKTPYERMHLQYPVPYMVFSPTYFYQSLYEVPYIKPLLKNNDAMRFSYSLLPPNQLENDSWEAYKGNPYNSYIRGLMNFMEVDNDSLVRRDHMTDHLLARYGYSPFLINEIITGSKYTGDALKDKVIYKSLLLQNLGLLSYYRQKAYNFLGAQPIISIIKDLLPVNPDIPLPESYYQELKNGYTVDFIFDSYKMDKIEKLKEIDFINYSALELNLNLLLGLRIQYEDFILNSIGCLLGEKKGCSDDSKEDRRKQIVQAHWLITNRKGTIAIETNLLYLSLNFIEIQEESRDDAAPIDLESFENEVLLFIPKFIPQFETAAFERRLNLLLESILPVHVICKLTLVDSNDLEVLILAFANWHDALIYGSEINMNKSATALIDVINKIKSNQE